MKIYCLLILLITIFFCTSCEKDKTYMIYGKWVIEGGEVYVFDGNDAYNRTETMYHYFGMYENGDNITKACIRYQDAPIYPFDIIIKDTTIWEFTDKYFIVNNKDTFGLKLGGNQGLYNLKDVNGQVQYYDYVVGILPMNYRITYDMNKECDRLDLQIYEMINSPYFRINSKLHFKRVK